MSQFKVSTTTTAAGDDPSRVGFEIAGDFDATQIARFRRAVAALPDDLTAVTVDVSQCTILDSSALGALIDLKHRLDDLGATLITVADKPFQRLILQHTGLAEYLGSTE